MLDGLGVVIGSYLTILCCPSIDFFVRTTNSTIAEGLLSNKIYKKIIKAIFVWQKEDQFESIVFKKSDIIQKSEKADLLSSNKNAVCYDWCQQGVVLCQNCV